MWGGNVYRWRKVAFGVGLRFCLIWQINDQVGALRRIINFGFFTELVAEIGRAHVWTPVTL